MIPAGWNIAFATFVGNLQNINTQQNKVNSTLLIAANITVGVTGKITSPQFSAAVCAALGEVDEESGLNRFASKRHFVFATIIGIITEFQVDCLIKLVLAAVWVPR